jgi:very-short-patch-repair endonuclease
MAALSQQSRRAWAIAARQYGVITHRQLAELGFSAAAIKHRVAIGRLHPRYRGVYAVGRRDLSRHGRWMAAVLACGPGAVISHFDAGALYAIVGDRPGPIHVTVARWIERPGITVHRGERTVGRFKRIPVTSPVDTVIDLAACLSNGAWEAAVNEADSLDLCTPDQIRAAAEALRRPGVKRVKLVLDRATFVLTDSELERLFLRIVRRAGLPKPLTRQSVNGWRVDFYWPDLKLVVECDSLRYHRTALKQTRDVLRDQAHAVAKVERLRFTHWQIKHDPGYVGETLRAVAAY